MKTRLLFKGGTQNVPLATIVLLVAFTSVVLSGCNRGQDSGGQSAGETRVIYQQTQTGTAGGKCSVVQGPNAGRSGTYDGDGDCCDEGPNGWGCTECKGQDGKSNGKCADKGRLVVSDYFDVNGDRQLVVEDYYQLPDGRIVHGLTVLPVASQSVPKTTSFPIEVHKIGDLRKSSDAMDKLIADSVESSMSAATPKIK